MGSAWHVRRSPCCSHNPHSSPYKPYSQSLRSFRHLPPEIETPPEIIGAAVDTTTLNGLPDCSIIPGQAARSCTA